MPELPEVETTVRQVRSGLVGRRVRDVRVHWTRTVAGGSVADFRGALVGTRIVRVWRRGKFFVFDLARAGGAAGHVVGHLRMTGRLWLERDSAPRAAYARLELVLDNGRRLVFADTRKFGRMQRTDRVETVTGHLGPEPLSASFTADWLADALRQRRRRIKPLLLDQSFIAGLGNIYVDEALHAARLHPECHAAEIGGVRVARLRLAIRRILAAAIRREGSSFDAFYRTPEGQPGRYQERFRVYGREGRPCRRCQTPIVRILVGQRGTHLCPRCQPPCRPRQRVASRG
jgi:formamidopyrimidine-DNA glycosylase